MNPGCHKTSGFQSPAGYPKLLVVLGLLVAKRLQVAKILMIAIGLLVAKRLLIAISQLVTINLLVASGYYNTSEEPLVTKNCWLP